MSVLINEELPGRLTSYYGKVEDIDSIAYGNLLLRKRQLLGNVRNVWEDCL